MSKRSNHDKCDYKLQKLPRCSKCKIEFILISVCYESNREVDYEWECQRCKKTVAANLLKSEPASDQDARLTDRFNYEHKRSSKRISTKTRYS